MLIETTTNDNSGLSEYSISNYDTYLSQEDDEDSLKAAAATAETEIADCVDMFEKDIQLYADEVLDSVFPLNMGDVNTKNKYSIYGFLTKTNIMGEDLFVHPVSARYLLYKLSDKLKASLSGDELEEEREVALRGGDDKDYFDNPKTRSKVEETFKDYFDSGKKIFQTTDAFIRDFKERYYEFINNKVSLCNSYLSKVLKNVVFKRLIAMVEDLVKRLEAFFYSIPNAQQQITDEIAKNIEETSADSNRTKYVFGKAEDKEAMYSQLSLGIDYSDTTINKSVIDAVYGSYCAERRPVNINNSKYKNISIISLFVRNARSIYAKKMEEKNNSGLVDMDIYAAICKEVDVQLARSKDTDQAEEFVNFSTDEDARTAISREKYIESLQNYLEALETRAKPFLFDKMKEMENAVGAGAKYTNVFWGFNPIFAKMCKTLGISLGVNLDRQKNKAYPKNVLYCYSAAYGIEAGNVPKFAEVNGAENYYKYYETLIDEMMSESDGSYSNQEFLRTPYLDKTWHTVLPYISEEKRKAADKDFYRAFWLAIAYRVIFADKDGKLFLRRELHDESGTVNDHIVPILYNDRQLRDTEVTALISLLKMNTYFNERDIPSLEHRYYKELDEMNTYVGTEVLSGLIDKTSRLNPIDVMSRYHGARGYDIYIETGLKAGLERVARELAERYYREREDDSIEKSQFRICKMIYDSASLSVGKDKVFASWLRSFKTYKLDKEKPLDSADGNS